MLGPHLPTLAFVMGLLCRDEEKERRVAEVGEKGLVEPRATNDLVFPNVG
jgi:hypothetical protein